MWRKLIVMWPLIVAARTAHNDASMGNAIVELPPLADVQALVAVFQPLDMLSLLVNLCSVF